MTEKIPFPKLAPAPLTRMVSPTVSSRCSCDSLLSLIVAEALLERLRDWLIEVEEQAPISVLWISVTSECWN